MNTELKNKLKTYASFTAGTTLFSTNVDAQIVHIEVNHTNAPSETYYLDIDGDGTSDFMFDNAFASYAYNSLSCSTFLWINYPRLYGSNGYYNGFLAFGGFPLFVKPIAPGFTVGPSLSFGYSYPSGTFFGYSLGFWDCSAYGSSIFRNYINDPFSFKNGLDKYIGIQFEISGQVHYGWIRVSVDSGFEPSTVTFKGDINIIDMAYESTPNTAIKTGAIYSSAIPASNTSANVVSGNIDVTFDASANEESVNEYRLFVVKEGTTFGLTEAEANSNYVSITPDGSPNYAHSFTTGTVDSDGNTVLRTSPTLDVSGEPLSANQSYSIYILNMGKTPYTYRNSLSTPSNSFTISSGLSTHEKTRSFNMFYNNGKLNINVDNTLVGANVKLYNTLGQNVLNEKLNTLSNSFNLNQSEGMYIVTIQKDDVLVSKKILVK
jgi:hypothetical protein